jgi:hypothetical protein
MIWPTHINFQCGILLDNIKMSLGVVEWDDMDWIDPAQDRDQWKTVVNTAVNFPFQ